MLCGNCRKNQATKTYEQIKKGKQETAYYCLDCYHKLFLNTETDGTTPSVCPYCGTTVAEFKRRKIVGCANCYQILQGALMPTIVKMQGQEVHKGKPPVDSLDRLNKRVLELKLLADKCKKERDFDGARAYEEEAKRLKRGEGNTYVASTRIH